MRFWFLNPNLYIWVNPNSYNIRMTEVLLAEIGRRPADDKNFDREGYSLAAGIIFRAYGFQKPMLIIVTKVLPSDLSHWDKEITQ